MASWHKEQIQGPHAEKFGEEERAGAEGEEGVEEGSGHGWSDSGGWLGVKRGKAAWAWGKGV